MNGARQAALALHSAAAQDRRWILSQLTIDQQSQVATLLEELKDLGFPEGGGDIELPSEPKPPLSPEPFAEPPLVEPLERIRCASADEIRAVLASEPAGLLATLQQIEAFAWSRNGGVAVRAGAPNTPAGSVAPARVQAVLAEVAGRLNCLDGQRQIDRAGGKGATLRGWLQRMRSWR
jgi:hypothetical protein